MSKGAIEWLCKGNLYGTNKVSAPVLLFFDSFTARYIYKKKGNVVPNIGTWFHEFLYPLDYLSKYQKDKKKKNNNLVLYNR